ncbi:hypothetical protein EOPP23_03415 [Endozoicomonas sp. OPT23]|uniref:hypothetical protein n=1 Tax=Endozoicomonas sp. OPT23 TaxID=2072845 RepID=UPI00129B0793|nr:hypothetical protein [Endozoicomonas sp. OPT23]MRI32048.1 hypothetical protein [Endozoicomonas sp. OPT23]
MLLSTGCSHRTDSISLTQQELQKLVDSNYLSPQIRNFELMPLVNVQLYLETPELMMKTDGQDLAFALKGSVDADLFGNAVTDRIPLRVSGAAALKYVPEEHSFYFTDLELQDAFLDLELTLVQTLVMEQFRKTLSRELMLMPIIPLKQESPMYRRLGTRNYAINVDKGVLKLQKLSKTTESSDSSRGEASDGN